HRRGTKNNLEMYANESHRSLTVSNIKCPIEVKSFIDQVFDQGHLIASGYGDLKNSYFRIGHMGILQEKDIEDLLQKIQEILHHD
ncbi:hypothetical protein MJH12_05735, partial [bacterium]|nr:hypothetical protein [bacterium]